MNALCLLASCLVGQYSGLYVPRYYPAFYGSAPVYSLRTGVPTWLYDPIGYSRFYNGAGYYSLGRQVIARPREIVLDRAPMNRTGLTGRVLALDEGRRRITLRLPAETVQIHFGPETRWRSLDGTFAEVVPGAILNVDAEGGTITILGLGPGPGPGKAD